MGYRLANEADTIPELMVGPEGSGASRYQRGRELGRGGMGEIVSTHDRVVGRPVAIKYLPHRRAPADP